MDKEYDKRMRKAWRGPESGNTHWFTQNYTKKYQTGKCQAMMEYMVFLVQEIHLHSRQRSSRNEQMPTKTTLTRMDEQRKDHIDSKRPKQRNRPKQLQTHNLPTDDMENIYSTNKGRNLLLANKPRIVPWGTERMLQRIQKHSKVTLHRSTHPKQEQKKKKKTRRKNLPMAWIDYKKAYDIITLSWMINCIKMYKISHEVINFIEKTMKTWWVELTARRRSLAEAKTQKGIFQGDARSLFIIAMRPFYHIFRKCTAGYKVCSSQKKINHLMYMDDSKKMKTNWEL